MSNIREIVCIICPNGCRMNVQLDADNKVSLVENALCEKGKTYAIDEIQFPKRSLTSTIRVIGGELPLVSVRSDKPIPKERIQSALAELKKIELKAPVAYHQVVISDLFGIGANIITTKEVLKKT